MGLEATIQNSVNILFDSLDDLVGDLTLRKITQGSFDVPNTVADSTFTGAFDSVKEGMFDGNLVESNDMMVYMKPSLATPIIGDIVLDTNLEEFTIIDIAQLKTYDTVFAWMLLVRR